MYGETLKLIEYFSILNQPTGLFLMYIEHVFCEVKSEMLHVVDVEVGLQMADIKSVEHALNTVLQRLKHCASKS
jgi:hypothetical protein